MSSSRSNELKKRKRVIKRIGVIVTMFALIMAVFFIGKSFISPDKAVADEEHVIQLVHPMNEKKLEKKAPTEYNGKMRKVVYLTFDDGPSKQLPEVLDILAKEDVKATFFMIGGNLKNSSFVDSVKRAVKEGHYVGAHSMTHQFGNLYTKGQFVPEMDQAIDLIKGITGENPRLVRPPYGSMPGLNQKLRDEAAADKLKVWDWTIDSLDWKMKGNPKGIVEEIRKQLKNPVEVILMHEIHPQSLAALPDVIKVIKEAGYEFEVYNENNHFPVNFWKDNRL